MGNQVLSIVPPPWFLLFSFFLKRMHNPEYGNYSSLSQWGYGPILHKLKGTVRYGTVRLYYTLQSTMDIYLADTKIHFLE